MSKVNVMVDLETLGTAPNSVLLSIGAVMFDSMGAFLADDYKFYTEVALEQQMQNHVIDLNTIRFWNDEAAKSGVAAPYRGTVAIPNALNAFNEWLVKISSGTVDNLVVWANGTDFDIPILRYNLEGCGLNVLWKYNAVRDCRTLFKLADVHADGWDAAIAKQGVAHNALDDAVNQANKLAEAFKTLSLAMES